MNQKFVFIGGAPRSGTTLIQRCLNAHPNIYGGPEFDDIGNIVELRDCLQKTLKKGRTTSYYDKKELDLKIQNFIKDLLGNSPCKSNYEIISEKTPKNILYFDRLVNIFPSAYYIFVLREPKAILNSMKQVGKKMGLKYRLKHPTNFISSTFSSVRYIKNCLDVGFKAEREHPEKVLMLYYEKFIEEQLDSSKNICAFLKIDWNETMLSPEQSNFDRSTNKDTSWYTAKAFNRPIDKEVEKKWIKGLTNFEKNYIDYKIRGLEKYEKYPYRSTKSVYPSVIFLGYELLMRAYIILNRSLWGIIRAIKIF